MQFVNQYNISSPTSSPSTIKYESVSQFIKTLPTDIEKFNENDIKNILLKIYQCTSTSSAIGSCGSSDNLRSSRRGLSSSTGGLKNMLQQQQQQQQQQQNNNNNNNNNEECKAKIELLYKYILPLNQKYPNLVSSELIQQLLTHYLPFVLPKKVVLDSGEDISRYWGLYIVYNVNNFVPILTNHLKQLYTTITSPNFEQYQHMIKYYKAVSPTLNNEMYKFKDYYSSMLNNYYLNVFPPSSPSALDQSSTQVMLEIWYSYLCLCDQNQNQLEFSKYLRKQLKGEQLVDFICKFNKNYFDNKTLDMDAFTGLVESLFTNEDNKKYIFSNLDKSKFNILLDLCKSIPKLNIYLDNFN